jgi:hypothetical protein
LVATGLNPVPEIVLVKILEPIELQIQDRKRNNWRKLFSLGEGL